MEKGSDSSEYLASHLLYIVWDATEVVEFSRKHTARRPRQDRSSRVLKSSVLRYRSAV